MTWKITLHVCGKLILRDSNRRRLLDHVSDGNLTQVFSVVRLFSDGYTGKSVCINELIMALHIFHKINV